MNPSLEPRIHTFCRYSKKFSSEHFCWFLKKKTSSNFFWSFYWIFFGENNIHQKIIDLGQDVRRIDPYQIKYFFNKISFVWWTHFCWFVKKYFIWSQSIWLASPTRSMILRCILFFQNKIKKSNKKVSEAHKTFLQRSISILIFHNKLFFLCWKESHLNSRGHSSIIQNYSLEMWGLYFMKLSCETLQNFATFL